MTTMDLENLKHPDGKDARAAVRFFSEEFSALQVKQK